MCEYQFRSLLKFQKWSLAPLGGQDLKIDSYEKEQRSLHDLAGSTDLFLYYLLLKCLEKGWYEGL